MNQHPLQLKINGISPDEINLKDIPEIKDFFVSNTKGLEFKSETYGSITSFPWFDNIDKALKELPKQYIPGIDGKIWDEEDQGWRVVIFRKDGFIVVFETNNPYGDMIETYFKVKEDMYVSAWKKVMGTGYFQNDNKDWKGWWKY